MLKQKRKGLKKPKKWGDFLSLAKERKTTYEFSTKKIKESDIKEILEAGRWAPSCHNTQPWEFLVLKNKKMMEHVLETTFYGEFHTAPSHIIAVVLKKDYEAELPVCIQDPKIERLEAHFCTAMAALSMVFEATSLGIASAFLTPEQKGIKKILHLGKEEVVSVVIALGYEQKGAFQKKRERKSLNQIVFYKEK